MSIFLHKYNFTILRHHHHRKCYEAIVVESYIYNNLMLTVYTIIHLIKRMSWHFFFKFSVFILSNNKIFLFTEISDKMSSHSFPFIHGLFLRTHIDCTAIRENRTSAKFQRMLFGIIYSAWSDSDITDMGCQVIIPPSISLLLTLSLSHLSF